MPKLVTFTDFIQYTASMRDLAEAVLIQGTTMHTEPNLGVYNTLPFWASAVKTYGQDLYNDHLISTSSVIRTITVENAISDAQNAWSSSLYRRLRTGGRRSD